MCCGGWKKKKIIFLFIFPMDVYNFLLAACRTILLSLMWTKKKKTATQRITMFTFSSWLYFVFWLNSNSKFLARNDVPWSMKMNLCVKWIYLWEAYVQLRLNPMTRIKKMKKQNKIFIQSWIYRDVIMLKQQQQKYYWFRSVGNWNKLCGSLALVKKI